MISKLCYKGWLGDLFGVDIQKVVVKVIFRLHLYVWNKINMKYYKKSIELFSSKRKIINTYIIKPEEILF